MNEAVWAAVLALVGSLVGTFGGIVTSSKLTSYRIEQLEKKVDMHNSFALKIPLLEQRLEQLEKSHKE